MASRLISTSFQHGTIHLGLHVGDQLQPQRLVLSPDRGAEVGGRTMLHLGVKPLDQGIEPTDELGWRQRQPGPEQEQKTGHGVWLLPPS
jgi:hypothetical protein